MQRHANGRSRAAFDRQRVLIGRIGEDSGSDFAVVLIVFIGRGVFNTPAACQPRRFVEALAGNRCPKAPRTRNAPRGYRGFVDFVAKSRITPASSVKRSGYLQR